MEPPTLPPLPNSKIRLMCSYGGHIVSRPHNKKSLCYAGGETRIVAVDRRATAASLSSLSLLLSRTLFNNRPFILKYQLPNEDLDSLISVTTEEDLHNMLEEHDRISTSPTPSRIRLFLFPCKPESIGSVLLDPKSETWFSDALKSTMIINRGLSAETGLLGLDCGYQLTDSSNGESLSGDDGRCGGGDSGSMPETMALESCSSFGSSSSSVSMSNLPPIGVHGEDGGAGLVDKKSKVVPPVSGESENSASTAVSYQKTGIYQDHVVCATSPGINVSSNTLESESILYNPSSMIQMQKPIQVSGYQLPHIPDQKHQQEVQYIHTGPHYIQQYPTGPIPISSYYPMYVPYQPNQPYPVYLMPVGPATQSCNMPVGPTTQSKRTPEPATEFYRMGPPVSPFNTSAPSHHQNQQDMGNTSKANASYDDEYDDDLAYAQIYKSQPPAPKYKTMTKADNA